MSDQDWVDLDKDVENMRKVLDEVPDNLRGEVFARTLVSSWGEDVGKMYGLLEYSKKMATASAKADGKIYERLPQDLYEYMYKVILEEGVDPSAAVSMASEIFDHTEEWINNTKVLKHPKKQITKVYKAFDKTAKQRNLKEKGVVTAKDLTNHSTPYGQLQRLYKGVRLLDWIKDIEDSLEDVKTDLKTTKSRVELAEASIVALEKSAGVVVDKEYKIQIMKESGLTQKEVADNLNISLSTVKRKWNV